MWLYSIVTYLHFILIVVLFSALMIELVILEKIMTNKKIALLKKADLIFGISSGLVILTGILRVYFFGKGVNYYVSNSLFILKISLFIIIGLLSIYPTITFIKSDKKGKEPQEINNFKLIRIILKVELILFLVIPLLAVFIANGMLI